MKQIALVWILGLFAASGFAGELAGQKLLITSVRTGDTEVFVVDPETGDAQNVSRSPKSEDRYPCWSPDGKRICFMSDREGTTNLWIANADGSQARRLNRTLPFAICRVGRKPRAANALSSGSMERSRRWPASSPTAPVKKFSVKVTIRRSLRTANLSPTPAIKTGA